MKSRADKAVALHQKGYNCAQCVVCAYCDVFGMEEKQLFAISEGFGAGMGGLREVCGVATGAFMLAGLKHSDQALEQPASKKQTYEKVKQLGEEFAEIAGSMMCRDIIANHAQNPRAISCDGCIHAAALLVEKYLLDECTRTEDKQ